MDKHYARRMRAWLRADFDPTRHPSAEEQRPPVSDEVRPPRRHSTSDTGRPVHERAPEVPVRREDSGEPWVVRESRPAASGEEVIARRRGPAPQADSGEPWVVREPRPAAFGEGRTAPAPQADPGEPWAVRESRPAASGEGRTASAPQADPGEAMPPRARRPENPAPQPALDEAWTVRRGELIIPVPEEPVLLPVPRFSRENGVRMSPAEERSRRNHPSNWRREDPASGPMTEAEERSRRNHPANWHRLRREEAAKAAEQRRPDQPGGR
jgi:hypothetical protein